VGFGRKRLPAEKPDKAVGCFWKSDKGMAGWCPYQPVLFLVGVSGPGGPEFSCSFLGFANHRIFSQLISFFGL
jgi:hypothetical protein